MIDDIRGDKLQTAIPLDDLNLLGRPVFQLGLLGRSQILILQNFVKLLAEVFVLVLYLRYPLLVIERDCGAVIHGLLKIVLADVITEPGVGFPVAPQERCAGKSQILGVRETGA